MTKTIKNDLKKVNKVLHPRSRKALKLHEKANKLITRQKSKKIHAMKENVLGEKLMWFKERLVRNVRRYTGQMCLDAINKYLSRFDEELEQIKIVHSLGKRKNRRFASREDIINLTVLHEKEEFETCGLEVPDLLNAQQLELLKEWNGELRFLQNFCLKRYTRKQLEANKDTLCPADNLSQDEEMEAGEDEIDEKSVDEIEKVDEVENSSELNDMSGDEEEETEDKVSMIEKSQENKAG